MMTKKQSECGRLLHAWFEMPIMRQTHERIQRRVDDKMVLLPKPEPPLPDPGWAS
jgi:hypothetical protein